MIKMWNGQGRYEYWVFIVALRTILANEIVMHKNVQSSWGKRSYGIKS